MRQEELVFQFSLPLVDSCVQAPDPNHQVSHFFLLAVWGAEVAHNESQTHLHCLHLIPQYEMAVSLSVSFCHF